jgi:hypothetical protein
MGFHELFAQAGLELQFSLRVARITHMSHWGLAKFLW